MNRAETNKLKRLYRIDHFLIISFLLIGFGLRAYQLDGQSLWSDEGISLMRSLRTFDFMLDSMPPEQMPGYYVVLHGWIPLTGENDYALRFLSLWPSVLAIALTYRLATDLGSRRAGLVGALLMATNPFQIWYAQEARPYSWLLAVGLLSSWLFWRLVTAERRAGQQYWLTVVSYGIATAGVVYLHYYGALVPLAHVVFAVGWGLYHREMRFLRDWMGGALLSLLLFLPWAPHLFAIFDFPGWREPIDPWQMPWTVLTFYSVGETLTAPWRDWLPWLYLGLLLLGLVGWWQVGRRSLGFLLAVLMVPLLVTFGIALQTLDYHERYTMVATAPLLLLAAGGLTLIPMPTPQSTGWTRSGRWLGQLLGVALIVVLLLGNRAALLEQYYNDSFHKPDFRTAVEIIKQYGQEGDIVLIDGPDPNLVFLHYYDAPYPFYDMRPYLDQSQEEVFAAMAEKTANAKRVWELLMFHEPWAVQQWLGYFTWSTPASDHNSIRMSLYSVDGDGMVPSQLDLPVGDALRLESVELTPQVVPGTLLKLTTHWRASQPLPEYKFSLRLVNGAGEIVQAQDYVPMNWFFPTPQWPVGEPIPDRRAFFLPAEFPTGSYQVLLRLYEPSTGVVLETPQGQDILLGNVTVGR